MEVTPGTNPSMSPKIIFVTVRIIQGWEWWGRLKSSKNNLLPNKVKQSRTTFTFTTHAMKNNKFLF